MQATNSQGSWPSHVLTVDGLCKSFGDTEAVSDVTFRIQPGEIFGLLGPNGAGKTTTISIVCGLLKPDRGEVVIDGFRVASHPRDAQKAMGVVPQELAIYEELSAQQNLLFWGRLAGLSRRDAKQRSDELLEALSLADRATDRVRDFSGGMKRRINLGCALLHRPKLLLLDEPTVGIDPQARANILDFVTQLARQGTGVLYTTHYLEEAESICDRIGIIDQGRLLSDGTLSELQSSVGGDQLFVLEGDLQSATPHEWDGFNERFRVIHQSDRQLIVSSIEPCHAADGLRDLLAMPIEIENASVKRPNLNDVFLQLTGRELRE